MIVDVPDHQELKDTAVGWLNLAWETTIEALSTFQENVEYYNEHVGEEMSADQADAYWHAQRYKLNNAISLLQQAMELFLKARIAQVSPFLLIAAEPQHWPRGDANGVVSFSDFRTIDASHLARSAAIAGPAPLHPDFNAFYERIRKHRNKIAHLNAGNIRVEARKILIDVLTAFRFLFPDDRWLDFRRNYVVSTGATTLAPYDDDPTHSLFLGELRTAIGAIERQDARLFFSFDPKKEALPCPVCMGMKARDWDDVTPQFAQRQQDGRISCIACASIFTIAEYEEQAGQWFD